MRRLPTTLARFLPLLIMPIALTAAQEVRNPERAASKAADQGPVACATGFALLLTELRGRDRVVIAQQAIIGRRARRTGCFACGVEFHLVG